jgi:hypothetical protein
MNRTRIYSAGSDNFVTTRLSQQEVWDRVEDSRDGWIVLLDWEGELAFINIANIFAIQGGY